MAELVDALGSGSSVRKNVLVRLQSRALIIINKYAGSQPAPDQREGRQGLQSRAHKMYYTYVLRSLDGKHRYVGHCKNLQSRLNQHNSRNVKATKAFRPWKIVHAEKIKTREEAIARERYLKSGIGREWMDTMNL